MRACNAGEQRIPVVQHSVGIEALRLQPVARALIGVLGSDLGDVARLPVRAAVGRWLQAQPVDGATDAAGVEVAALQQRPRLVLGRCPIGQFAGVAAELAEQLLPVAQGGRVGVVDFNGIEQRMRAMLTLSSAREGAVTEPMKGLSDQRIWAYSMSKCRLFTGRSTGSHTVPPEWCSQGEL